MSLLSQIKKGNNNTYIKLILYEAHFFQNIKDIKNIFPYIISIQFNNNSEKIISPIQNYNEIFNISNTVCKYFIRKKDKKILISINCFTKASFKLKKQFASCKIEIENINNLFNKPKNLKKWYFLKNKKSEKIIKLLISIDIIKNENNANNLNFNKDVSYIKTETDLEQNIIINKPETINIHINSITNNNLNIITNNIYMNNFVNISFLNDSIRNPKNNTMITKNCNSSNLFSDLLMKNECNKNLKNSKLNNNLGSIIGKIIKKVGERISPKIEGSCGEKQILDNKNNKFIQKKVESLKQNSKQNELKKNDKNKWIYENQYLDLNINYNELKNKSYRDDIIKDIRNYEKEVIYNINNIIRNNSKIYENNFNKEKLSKELEFSPYQKEKEKYSKDIEKSTQNNYFNNQRYSFESNGKTNSSIYLYKKNYHKISFNNKDIYNTSNILYNENDSNNEDISTISNLILKKHKKKNNMKTIKSKSNSPDSEKYGKMRLITDHSRTSFIINDLYTNNDQNVKQTSKNNKNILSINKILNIKNNNNNKLIKNKTNNIEEMNKNNKKYSSNLSIEKRKRKNLEINDENSYNLYYNLESKKKENNYKFLNNNNNKLKGSIFKQKTDNSLTKNSNQIKNKKISTNLNNQKSYNIFSINSINNKKGKKTNKLFKNVFKSKNDKNTLNHPNKAIKKEKINSIITLNTESSLLNNSILGRNPLMSFNKESSENTKTRNFKYIQYTDSYNQNNNHSKSILKPKINNIKKEINKNKRNLGKNANNIINKNTNSKEIEKKTIQLNKIGLKYSKLKNNFHFSKINKNNRNIIFQNKIIKKKDNTKLINNLKKSNQVLTNHRTHNNLNYKNIDANKPFRINNKNKTLNPFEINNIIKNKNNKRRILTIENVDYYNNNY